MSSWVPESCTLPTEEQPLRVAEFDTLFAEGLQRVERIGAGYLRLVLEESAEGRARELAQRETDCCSFFTFTFGRDADGRLLMAVTAPAQYSAVVEAMGKRAEAARGRS